MTTKLTLLTVVIFLGAIGSDPGLCEDNAKLPIESQLIIERLDAWESDQREELNKRVREKRAEVITALKHQLEETAKKGRLDGALEVKKKISILELPASPIELATWLVGRKIEFNGRSGRHIIEFKLDEAFLNRSGSSAQKVTYRALSNRTVELNWGTDYILKYNEDMTEATLISPAGQYQVTTSSKG